MGEKRARTSEDQKVCRHGREFLMDMSKTWNGLENGLIQTVWKASCITVKLF